MSNSLKILMLNNEFPPLGGGTGTVNQELFKQLSNYKNIHIDLITSGKDTETVIEQFSKNINIYKVKVNNRNIHHASNFELIKYTVKAGFKAIRLQRKNKYDFSFAWSTVPAGFVSFLLLVFFKLPYQIRIGGPDIPGFEKRYKTVYKIISPLIRIIWKKSNLIITKCKTEYDMVHSINPKLNIKTIYNGVNIRKFFPKEKMLNKPLRIICPARLIERKGQDILIKAIAALKKENIIFEVDFIGEGDAKEKYLQLAKNLQVEKQVKFSGYISREKMPGKYQEADLFVLPSYNEGMSNALLEALACGLPAIVTDVGGTEELVEESINGFVFEKGNVNQLVELLKNYHVRHEIIYQQSKQSVKKALKLDWKTITENYVQIFNDLKTNSGEKK